MTGPTQAGSKRVRRNQSMVFKGPRVLAGAIALLLAAATAAVPQEASAPAVMAIVPGAAIPATTHRPANSDVLTYWYGTLYPTPFVLQPGTGMSPIFSATPSNSATWLLVAGKQLRRRSC
jgi:hypothetical protein